MLLSKTQLRVARIDLGKDCGKSMTMPQGVRLHVSGTRNSNVAVPPLSNINLATNPPDRWHPTFVYRLVYGYSTFHGHAPASYFIRTKRHGSRFWGGLKSMTVPQAVPLLVPGTIGGRLLRISTLRLERPTKSSEIPVAAS